MARYDGTSGNDRYTGTTDPDFIYGYAGNDTLSGGAGADTIDGSDGNDTVDGGADNDLLYGGVGKDVVRGGDGDDAVYITSGADVVAGETYDGGAGKDTIYVQNGFDVDFSTSTLTGIEKLSVNTTYRVTMTAAQVDSLTELSSVIYLGISTAGTVDLTGAVSDYTTTFYLSSGGNRLVLTGITNGGGGFPGFTVFGDAGADTVIGGFGRDTINGGSGNDTLDGGDGDDTVDGGADVDSLTGGAGVDYMVGGDGNDTLDGGADNDLLYGGVGKDVVRGGTGDDTVYITSGADVVAGETYDGGDGKDTIYVQNGFDVDFSTSTLTGIEKLSVNTTYRVTMTAAQVDSLTELSSVIYLGISTAGTVDLTGAVSDYTTTFYLSSGGNRLVLTGITNGGGGFPGFTVFGDAGADTVIGGFGRDTINGGSGNDTLDGGDGSDQMNGQDGIDTASYASASAAVTVSLALQSNDQNTLGAGTDYLLNLENLTGSRFADTLTGDANANVIEGGAGNDALDGGAGKDSASYAGAAAGVTVSLAIKGAQATGGAGNDKLTGFEGLVGSASADKLTGDGAANTLAGGGGDDVLHGDGGADRIVGGDGTDVAVYSGRFADYDIVAVAGGYTVTDRRSGKPDGVDTLIDVETIRFANGDFAIGSAVNTGPSAVADARTPLREAGGRGPGIDTASGNVLANDVDPNLRVSGLGETLVVTGVQFGGTGGSFGAVAATGDTIVNGTYGTLTIKADGTYGYQLDNTRAATEALATGQAVMEVFGYRIVDAHGASSAATLTLSIDGDNETTLVANPDKLLVTLGTPSALAVGVLIANDEGIPGETLSVTAVSNAVGCTVAIQNGLLVVTASAATGSFDYTLTNEIGATRTGHVEVGAVEIKIPSNVVTTAADVTAADLVGNRNADRFTGGGGNDRLVGGAGDDVLDGRGGADGMIGGAGNDSYGVDQAGDRVVESTGDGIDTVATTLGAYTLGVNVENLASAGTGDFAGTGNALANALTGGNGNDTLAGGDGDDLLAGGRGADLLDGGAGVDTASYATATRGVSADLSTTDAQATGNGTDTFVAIENLTGSTFDDVLFGNDGVNTLTGGGGRDVLMGNDGKDVLDGGAGQDTLFGGAGDDRIIGGADGDVLHGGTGADRFIVSALGDSPSAATDRILDFSHAAGDLIDLSAIDPDSAVAGDQAFTFIGAAAFTGAGGSAYEVRVTALDADTFLVEADANHDGTADLACSVTATTLLQSNDFVL